MKKIAWFFVGGLVVLSLVLASCAQAVIEEEEEALPEEEQVVVPPEEQEAVLPSPGEPKYGGVFRLGCAHYPTFFDHTDGSLYWALSMYWTNETLLQGDWTKGPAGTGEATWVYLMMPALDLLEGQVAESWELADPQTIVFKIRKGIRFHDKPPTNGREMTADDVVFSLHRLFKAPKAYAGSVETYFGEMELEEAITAPDKWTVIVKSVDPEMTGTLFAVVATASAVVPRDLVEEYEDLKDWENACGTGPFTLVDYVSGSSLTFERHPNYWMKDPLYPQNTLPYVDSFKWLIIPDASTRYAALRTGKVDVLGFSSSAITREDALQITKYSPDVGYKRFPAYGPPGIHLRVDEPELPWYDKKVRRALHMAINRQEMAETLYEGDCDILAWPIPTFPEFRDMYIPLDELPESCQELYEYDPEKAKQLLAEAGYPDGFKCEVVSTGPGDYLSIIKAYWEKIGVDLIIDTKEIGAYFAVYFGHTHKHGFVGSTDPTCFSFSRTYPGMMTNWAMIDDPVINEAKHNTDALFFNEAERRQVMRDVVPYIVDQAYILVPPAGYRYRFWQPWVKGYDGEYVVGGYGSMFTFHKFVWLDQDLREEMTGRR